MCIVTGSGCIMDWKFNGQVLGWTYAGAEDHSVFFSLETQQCIYLFGVPFNFKICSAAVWLFSLEIYLYHSP